MLMPRADPRGKARGAKPREDKPELIPEVEPEEPGPEDKSQS